jgi:oligoendopeptidase F
MLVALAAALALAAAPAPTPAASRDRAQVPEKYTWSLSDLYPSDAAWKDARADVTKRVAAFAGRHQGKLGTSPKALGDALTELASISNALDRVWVYAMLKSDEDTREAPPREMKDQAERIGVDFEAATSFVRPEILALDVAIVKRARAEDPRLQDWSFYLDDLLRWKPHTLGANEERVVARAGDLATAGRSIHGLLLNADVPWPTVKLSTGEEVRLDPAGYQRARTARDPADREKVFRAFFGAVKGYERTIGAALAAHVKGHLFEKDVHGFPSALESALFRDNIPPSVYHRLVADVNAALPTLHRYLGLRKRMLGLKELRYEDLYAPLVKGIDDRFTPDQGMALTVAALAPLGEKYVATLTKGFASRWTDFLPSVGKRSGAYSTAVYGVHPYQLLNFNGMWTDVSTLAHEAGHSIHSALALETQPYPKADYPTFVAEVASTLNENLLYHHVLAGKKNDQERLALLGEHLETLRTTLFRQTMFAEFELAVHERAEAGDALSGEALSALYLDLVRKYYGHAQGHCRVDERYGVEWASVPHFFNYDFYVFQYSTSLIASTALAKDIRAEAAQGRTEKRDRYLTMLAAGGSDYGVDLLKRAGVDMTTSEPTKAAIAEMNATIDEIEKILAKGAGVGRKAAR